MMKLLEKYYNINYYCAYKLLFFILNRMLNPFYWLSFSKWKNGYINRCISISFWIFSLVCLACSKILSVQLVRIILENDIIFYSLLVVFCICGYYVNEIFLFKNDKYRTYFAEFDKKKRYLLYYGIYVVSLVVRWATFYLLLSGA